ncbi:MAG TPA: tyrosine-type recombinase/integrase [Oscillospiraceae bacterium]|nr:tyrosine-type recombinase/integrase [Oscillospiraceae bacterium]HRW57801.1 tyrosine-type recombinase/integrase [Oscillospiraceae bacterium]
MATARVLPSGNYRVRVHYEGGYKSFTRPTKREAERAAALWLSGVQEELSQDPTLQEAVNRYIENKRWILSPSTIRAYESLRHYFLEYDHFKISALSAQVIQRFISDIAKTHSQKTVRNASGLLTAVIRSVNPSYVSCVTLPQRVKPEYTIPDDEEVRRLLDAAKGLEIEKAILLAAFGSLRRSEIAALTPEDFNLKEHTVRVSKALVMDDANTLQVKGPKTTAGSRTITLPEAVFDAVKSGVPLTPNQITKQFEALCRKIGVHYRFHDLRHYHASMLHALGVPDKYIMERGGWGSATVLSGIYEHTFSAKQKEVGDQVTAHFDAVMNGKSGHE